jgi:hypothetical protein
MQSSITFPYNWGQPKFSRGDRTRQGVIKDIQLCSVDRLLTCQCQNIQPWVYWVQVSSDSTDLKYFDEHEIQALSPSEVEAQILAEIDWCLSRLVVLQAELGADLKINTPFGRIPKLPTVSQYTGSFFTSRLSEPKREKVA